MTPSLRRLAYIVVVLLAAAGLSYCGFMSRIAGGHLDIEQAELQARIEPRFPTHHCKLLIACVDLSNPIIVLTDGDDHVGLTVDAKVKLGGRTHTGRVGFSGRPRYVPGEGQLFLDDMRITTLDFAGLPEEYAMLVKDRAPAVINTQLQARPIYTLDASTTRGALAKLAVRDVKVVNGKLRISFMQ